MLRRSRRDERIHASRVAECKVEVNLRAAEGAEWLARRTMVRYLNHSWILHWQIAIVTFSVVFKIPDRLLVPK